MVLNIVKRVNRCQKQSVYYFTLNKHKWSQVKATPSAQSVSLRTGQLTDWMILRLISSWAAN